MQVTFEPRTLVTTVCYAGASGDLNPLHYDSRAAERAGFARVLVHGGYLAAFMENVARAHGFHGEEYAVRFIKPLMIGERFSIAADESPGALEIRLIGEGDKADLRASAALRGRVSQTSAPPADFEPQGAPYPWVVEEGALRNFLLATTDEPTTVDARTEATLCFLGNAARWSTAKESIVRRLGFDYSRMLHGETRTEVYADPIKVGERFMVTEAHGNRSERPHRSGGVMRSADAIHEIADMGGRVRARVFNKMLERPAKAST